MVTAAAHQVDGRAPASVEHPTSPAELAAALAQAAASGLAVIPVGGGRALGMGNPPDGYDLALETTGLDRVIEVRAADLTVTVEAGISLEALQSELGKAGQFLPLDPFGSPGHSIGGLLASGWSGPLRLRYGPPRDYLIGLQVALPDGRLVRSGGRVVKNVSGYDLNKLHLGALGSMGVITEATFKVYPLPLSEITVSTTAGGLAGAWAAARRALEAPLPPASLSLLPPALGGWKLVARIAGTGGAVQRMAQELGWEEADPAFWVEHSRRGSQSWARIAAPRTSLQGLVRLLPERSTWFAEPGVGIAHWLDATDPELIRRVRAAAVAAGGSLVLLAAPAELKHAVGAWGPEPASIAVMRGLRDQFDPRRTISPGRYLV